MSFLDPLIYGIRKLIDSADAEATIRPALKFTNATLTDDPTNDRTLVAFTRGIGDSDGAADEVQTSDGAGNFVGASDVKAGTQYVGVGATLPAIGYFRAGYVAAGAIVAKKDGGGNDRRVISHGSADPDATDFGDDDVPTYVKGSAISFEAAGVQQLGATATNLEGALPYIGDSANSSPYGAHGSVSFDIADADHTATAAQYAMLILVVNSGTVMTAQRKVKLPDVAGPLGASGSYTKFVQNDNGGGFAVEVINVSAGTSVVIADGKGAWVSVTTTGVRRMTADV